MKIGFIGLGMMGRPMAERLITQGFDVRVSDTNPQMADIFGEAFAQSAALATAGADVIVTMLPNGQVVRDALLGAGAGLTSANPGTIVIDCSSSDASGTISLGVELSGRGIHLVDAPVSGGVPRARDGKLALMVGGTVDSVYDQIAPVLEALGDRIVRVGPLGAGHAAKAINNAIAAATLAATAEGLLMGERFGLEPETLLEVLNSSTGRSAVSESVFRTQIIPRTYAQGFALGLMAKDVGIADAMRNSLGLDLPMLQQTHAQWQSALHALGHAADFTAFHAYVEQTLTEGR
ncbi:MAG: 2-hydroxy-3-oxopropionate reductase [Alphaproteobacteria bacterium]|nr:MAG: 2-hydroxy-3-oxopropionate reductase [Alphaproteobacteria bacterium]PZO41613.1 MAG: 2-hydroxy-3-oxopropionate reductase [Alphaproteobacteria bacterium]